MMYQWGEPFQINDRRFRERFKQGPEDAERAVADTVSMGESPLRIKVRSIALVLLGIVE